MGEEIFKYYWIVVDVSSIKDEVPSFRVDSVTHRHPFEEIKHMYDLDAAKSGSIHNVYTLINWKEIAGEEFELFKKLERF